MKRIYSAGIVSKGFWFLEFRKYIELKKEGKAKAEIIELQKKENIFVAPSKSFGIKIANTVSKRAESLPIDILELFLLSDIDTKKIINMISIMMTDRLLFEYINSSYRYEIMIGTKLYSTSSVRSFLSEKASQNEEVNKFTETTIKRMTGAYRTYLKEAGLLEEKGNNTYYKKIYLDYALEEKMINNNLEDYIKALKGEN